MTDGNSVSIKPAPPVSGYLCEQMTVGRMVEALEGLHFNKREQASLVLDPGVQAFLIRAAKALLLIISMRKFATRGARSDRRDEQSPLPAAVVSRRARSLLSESRSKR